VAGIQISGSKRRRSELGQTGLNGSLTILSVYRSECHRLMSLRVFHMDAFTARAFAGNPAAACPLVEWLDDKLLLAVAAENNLSETLFCSTGRTL
jgi:hypothetical protein